ncbi:carbohydrate ABC transporter permease [Gracilibacillus alcaliphilus]|uniref:carbohydrate ABC transporter permease n=1 Tax=Gracilibacillus alcaliphilus TaxID=1401441 RepID=UPI0019562EA1|nr:carbohydrate ABC transporter permease [Gracilibacillus alcaliphilus]MBM7676827.1 glucose/mannose transport system permease protein [Gracilibacillus alcaliphilus]
MPRVLANTPVYFILIVMSIIFVSPFYVLIVTALKPFSEVSVLTMWSLPANINFSSFVQAISELAPNLWNSFKMVIPATLISALLGSINGYALSKWKFKGSEVFFNFLLLGMFIPYQSILIPLIQTIDSMGLYNTITGLVLVHIVYGLPMTTLMFRNFYATIPHALIEASQMDGAGFFKTYFKVVFPLSITSFVVVGIWQFTNIWNEFLFAITITGHGQHPVMVALQNLSGSQVVEWNVQMAGALFAAIPTMLIYILAGRFFIKGLLAGSVKG